MYIIVVWQGSCNHTEWCNYYYGCGCLWWSKKVGQISLRQGNTTAVIKVVCKHDFCDSTQLGTRVYIIILKKKLAGAWAQSGGYRYCWAVQPICSMVEVFGVVYNYGNNSISPTAHSCPGSSPVPMWMTSVARGLMGLSWTSKGYQHNNYDVPKRWKYYNWKRLSCNVMTDDNHDFLYPPIL